jgi:hypothetical protein
MMKWSRLNNEIRGRQYTIPVSDINVQLRKRERKPRIIAILSNGYAVRHNYNGNIESSSHFLMSTGICDNNHGSKSRLCEIWCGINIAYLKLHSKGCLVFRLIWGYQLFKLCDSIWGENARARHSIHTAVHVPNYHTAAFVITTDWHLDATI